MTQPIKLDSKVVKKEKEKNTADWFEGICTHLKLSHYFSNFIIEMKTTCDELPISLQ